jgi:CheY-like chemotaxis protein
MVVLNLEKSQRNIENIFGVQCLSVDYGAFKSSPESEAEKEQFKISGKDFLPHRICEHIESNYNDSQLDSICIDMDSIGLEPSVLLACHLRLHNSKSEISKLPIIIIVDDLLEFHESPEWKELRGIHNFRNTQGFFFFQKSELAKSIPDETGAEISGFQRVLKEDIGSTRFIASDLSDFKVSPISSSESDSSWSNHSIANEWAIYRWASAIPVGTPDKGIEKVTNKIGSNLYFKYLKTVYPPHKLRHFSDSELNIKYSGSPNILYIDDDADKGWSEIFQTILMDCNPIEDFDYLGDEFIGKSKDEIIDISVKSVIEQNIDLVILDYRLHPDDFLNNNFLEITGLKILKKIKKLNPGIQVVIFSATNKVWNLSILQEAGADGFIIKESPENSIDSDFITQTIESFRSTIESCLSKRFLKDFYKGDYQVQTELLPRRRPQHERCLPKEFVNEALKWLRLSNDILKEGELNESKIVSSFLFKFSVLENLANRLIDVDNPIFLERSEDGFKKYKFQFRTSEKRLRNFIQDETNNGFYRKTNSVFQSGRNIPWAIKILNTIDFITEEQLHEEELTASIKKRNDFIHANSTTGDQINITIDDLTFLNGIIIKGLVSAI